MHGDHPTRDASETPDDLPEAAAVVLSAAEESAPKSRSLAPLRMVFGTALKYPRQIALALIALVITSAATLAIP